MRSWIIAIGLLFLTACGGGQGGTPVLYKPLYFTQYQPIYMAVSSIEIVDEYKPPMRPPYIEHLIPYSPSEAVRIWARDRLRTDGDDKTMQIIIRDGSVKTGSSGRFDANLEVEIRIYGEGVISEASIFVDATRNIVMPTAASDETRNRAFRKLIGDMMDEFNAEMEKNLFTYMGNYISYSRMP